MRLILPLNIGLKLMKAKLLLANIIQLAIFLPGGDRNEDSDCLQDNDGRDWQVGQSS